MVITSKSNPQIKEISKLASDKKFRDELGLYLVEGVKPVNECLSAGCDIKVIVCIEQHSDKYSDAVIVSDSVFSSISNEKTPQGVIAVVNKPINKLKAPHKS